MSSRVQRVLDSATPYRELFGTTNVGRGNHHGFGGKVAGILPKTEPLPGEERLSVKDRLKFRGQARKRADLVMRGLHNRSWLKVYNAEMRVLMGEHEDGN